MESKAAETAHSGEGEREKAETEKQRETGPATQEGWEPGEFKTETNNWR